MDPRTKMLLDGPVGPTLLRLAAPNVVVMAAQTSIGLIEACFIGRLGLDALTGVALVFPLLMLMQMMSAGGHGRRHPIRGREIARGGRRTLIAPTRWPWSRTVIALGLLVV